ncbi:ATP-dependent 6-phosphofructokinase [Adhaeretor mobilis]|uniref:Pyrophosphate--fructose 6-phosphate 1-phosphotransferase n=1 Tax=Adhaeretor mobilis TaxID=1930276 RepID=A0A517MRD2_9BACT|nr:ATP-dependent 6-phosphofructokinase [Adhaeretor mobilis]QDS97357.1 Pyrophosphate--fructose 6-phosphate 1-phosphotransferase [Adhaeretor mobilis]
MVHQPSYEPSDLAIQTLGPREFLSPLPMSTKQGDGIGSFTPDELRVLYEHRFLEGEPLNSLAFELAGARQKLFFDPQKVKAAIVTCGGLCPGLNNVIRTIVFELLYNYGAKEVLGIRFGYRGLNPEVAHPPISLTCDTVDAIHHQGGTILGTSRGHQDVKLTVNFLESEGINMLFCIGGDGTQRGAHAMAEEIKKRGLPIAIVNVPKTIDNDIKFCHRTFGFYTAVAEAEQVIDRAHVEAKSVFNGVGLVKLMGREAGFIAAAATVASGEANFCIVPEVPVDLKVFLNKLKKRLAAREHAVVVLAEGTGQHWLEGSDQCDASGNRKLGDSGSFLRQQINEFFAKEDMPVSVKYFDPSYYIRSLAATAVDSLLCERFARAAVHAAMAGKTDMFIGLWHDQLVHVPLELSTGMTKRLSPEGELWISVQALTGQEKW